MTPADLAAVRRGTEQCFARPRPRLAPGTKRALLLAVAAKLPPPFSLERLSLAAWEAHPRAFGFNSGRYPDRHTVICCLSGPYGLVEGGWLERVGRGLYRVAGDQPD